jgi:succinate dehydrogenase/fumarate reductase flavoprotein subunit
MRKKVDQSRRNFIRGAALATGAGILAGCAPKVVGTESPATTGETGAPVTQSAGTRPFGYMCDSDWLGKAPVISEADISSEETFDVVILGGGHAGTQAALGAAQSGASVVVIEKQPANAYTWKGDDICSYNSQFMIERGFGPYNTGEILTEYVKRAAGRCNPPIIEKFIANSGEMMDNMVSLVPSTSNLLDIEGGQAIIQVAYGKPDGSYYPMEQAGYKSWATTLQTIGTSNPTAVNGREGLSRLTEIETYVMLEAIRLGAKWYHEYEATVLVQNEAGDVTGAIVKGPDGKYQKLNATKGVLLATGDFAANPDMCWELLGEAAEYNERAGSTKEMTKGMSTSDGIGHKMGCWAGGFIEPNPRPTMSMGGGGGGPFGTAPFLWLNAEGKRYMNEAMTSAAYVGTLRQPRGIVTTITDKKWMQTVQGSSIDHGAPNWGYPKAFEILQEEMGQVYGSGAEGKAVHQVGIINIQMMAMPADQGFFKTVVFAADTLEELCGYLGYTGDSVKAVVESVKEYNGLCGAGKDTLFGKDDYLMIPVDEAPFYGCVSMNTGVATVGLVTLAGLVTNTDMQVLKADGASPIKGLYAAGNCLGGRYGNAYATPSAGNSMGMAMTHGRVAGKIIAAS